MTDTVTPVTQHTPGPWYIRRCDDSSSMNMTVISTQDWGPHNNSRFHNEPDTIAIVFHQLLPQISCEIDDLGDANAALIAAAPELLAAAKRAEQALVKMHAQRIWNERHSWDSAKSEEFANNNPLPEVSQLRAAIAKAKGQAE